MIVKDYFLIAKIKRPASTLFSIILCDLSLTFQVVLVIFILFY